MSKGLEVIEQKTVEFYEDELIAIRGYDGHIYVAIGQLSDALGLDRASQVRRIRNDEILVDGYQGSVNLTYPGGGTQLSGVLHRELPSVKYDEAMKFLREWYVSITDEEVPF